MRLSEYEYEGDFLVIWHKELPCRVAVTGAAILLVDFAFTLIILTGELWFDEDSSEVRAIYFGHQLVLMMLGLLLLGFGYAWIRFPFGERLNLEYIATAVYSVVFLLLPFCNPWRVSQVWGKDPDVWNFTHEQAESHLALAMSGAISVLCVDSRLRIRFLWAPVAAGTLSYIVMTESCKEMPDGQSPNRITELMIFVLAMLSLRCAWVNEAVARQTFTWNVKNGLLDSSSNKAPAQAMARVLRAVCDAVLEVDATQCVISADGLVGPIFGETVVGHDIASLWPSEENRMKAILERTSQQPCLVHTMSAALARGDSAPFHMEVFAVRVSPDDESEVAFQWLMGLRKTSQARIPSEARKRDRDGGASHSPANRSSSPASRRGNSPQVGNSPQYLDATANSPLRSSLKPMSMEVVTSITGGRPQSTDLVSSLDLDHGRSASKLSRSGSWPTKSEAKGSRSGSPSSPPISKARWSGRSPSLDQSPTRLIQEEWSLDGGRDDGMAIADEPAPAHTRVFQASTMPMPLQWRRCPSGVENGQTEMDQTEMLTEHGPLQHQESTTSLASSATAAGPLIVQTMDRRRKIFSRWGSETAFLGTVTLPVEALFEKDDPVILDQVRCTIIQCGRRLRRFGLKPGDCITHVDTEVVNNSDIFRHIICERWDEGEGADTTVDLTFRRVQEFRSNPATCPSEDNSSDKVTWRSMSSKAAANGMGLPSKALHDAKAKEFWKKTRLNRTSSSIGSTVHEEKEENSVALRLQLRRLSRTSSCLATGGSTGTDTPPDLDLEFLDP